ncbi:MAG: hypothetical protein RLZZ244_1025, partial [Verrucomicrobiota bacterium]
MIPPHPLPPTPPTDQAIPTGSRARAPRSAILLPQICILLILAFSLLSGLPARAQTLSGAAYAKSLLKVIPPESHVTSQPDGVVYLPSDSAPWVNAKAQNLVPSAPDGSPVWDGDEIRPSWRMTPAKAGAYRVVITRACPPGSESGATIHFRPVLGEAGGLVAVRGFIPPTESWTDSAPFTLGEVQLKAEEYLVEYIPRDWSNPKCPINLQDIRLIPLETFSPLERQTTLLLKRLGGLNTPEMGALRKHREQLLAEQTRIRALQNRKTFSDFTTYDHFLAYDREVTQARQTARRLEGELQATSVREALEVKQSVRQWIGNEKLNAQESESLKQYLAAYNTMEEQATRAYPKQRFSAPPASTGAGSPTPLFPTGDLHELATQRINALLPQVEIALPKPPDLAERRARFSARNSDQGLADLCRRFSAVLEPKATGLEEFHRLHKAGKPREALEAYRTFFFAKLAEPEKYGAHTQSILPMMTPANKTGGTPICQPHPLLLENALAGVAVVPMANKSLLIGKVGEPGDVLWAPREPALPEGVRGLAGGGDDGSPFWKTPEGQDLKQRILFYRQLKPICFGGDWIFTREDFSSSLFYSYVVRGNKAHLDRFCAYLDDYTLNAAADMDHSPLNIRAAMDHEPHSVLPALLCGLRMALDERPAFAHELNPATLVRLLMYAV